MKTFTKNQLLVSKAASTDTMRQALNSFNPMLTLSEILESIIIGTILYIMAVLGCAFTQI